MDHLCANITCSGQKRSHKLWRPLPTIAKLHNQINRKWIEKPNWSHSPSSNLILPVNNLVLQILSLMLRSSEQLPWKQESDKLYRFLLFCHEKWCIQTVIQMNWHFKYLVRKQGRQSHQSECWRNAIILSSLFNLVNFIFHTISLQDIGKHNSPQIPFLYHLENPTTSWKR